MAVSTGKNVVPIRMFTDEDFLFINQPFYAVGEKTVTFELEMCDEIKIEDFKSESEIVTKKEITKQIEKSLYGLWYNIGMDIKNELKTLIIKSLELDGVSPEDIKDNEPLFGEGLGLDSIDALELGMAIKRKYNITMSSNKEENKKYFYSIDTLSKYVEEKLNGN